MTEGRLAFVSQASFVPGSGRAAADAICQDEGGGNFLAAMATTTEAAMERFDLQGPPWVRSDGIMVLPSGQSLDSVDILSAPILLDTDGDPVQQVLWTGAPDPGIAALPEENCADWSSTSADEFGNAGLPNAAWWFNYGGVACNSTIRVPCFEE
jgi:hypothetical protein